MGHLASRLCAAPAKKDLEQQQEVEETIASPIDVCALHVQEQLHKETDEQEETRTTPVMMDEVLVLVALVEGSPLAMMSPSLDHRKQVFDEVLVLQLEEEQQQQQNLPLPVLPTTGNINASSCVDMSAATVASVEDEEGEDEENELYRLVSSGSVSELTTYIAEQGIVSIIRFRNSLTALHLAVIKNRLATAAFLLTAEGPLADINAVDQVGRSALHWAFSMNNQRMIDMLIHATNTSTATLSLPDKYGNSPMECITPHPNVNEEDESDEKQGDSPLSQAETVRTTMAVEQQYVREESLPATATAVALAEAPIKKVEQEADEEETKADVEDKLPLVDIQVTTNEPEMHAAAPIAQSTFVPPKPATFDRAVRKFLSYSRSRVDSSYTRKGDRT